MGKPPAISPDVFLDQRIVEGKFNCDICGNPYPISHLRIQIGTNGLSGSSRVGAFCCYEPPPGSSIDRDLHAAWAKTMVAKLSAKEMLPPMHNGEPYYGAVTIPETFSFVTSVNPPQPVILSRGGPPVAVALTGNNFDSSDVISYGSTGITDASPPVLVSATSRTLSVQASGGMSAGRYSFTFNGTKWTQLFQAN